MNYTVIKLLHRKQAFCENIKKLKWRKREKDLVQRRSFLVAQMSR